jgi:hypothetical protein
MDKNYQFNKFRSDLITFINNRFRQYEIETGKEITYIDLETISVKEGSNEREYLLVTDITLETKL